MIDYTNQLILYYILIGVFIGLIVSYGLAIVVKGYRDIQKDFNNKIKKEIRKCQ